MINAIGVRGGGLGGGGGAICSSCVWALFTDKTEITELQFTTSFLLVQTHTRAARTSVNLRVKKEERERREKN